MDRSKEYEGWEIEPGKKSYEYWCEQFNCERKDLIEAIFRVGSSAHVVFTYLEMNGKIKEN